VADIPFDNVAFYGKPVTWDEFVPDAGDGTVTQTKGSWYMLNTKFWGVRVDKETNFAPTPFIKPENQDAKTAHILWLGALGCQQPPQAGRRRADRRNDRELRRVRRRGGAQPLRRSHGRKLARAIPPRDEYSGSKARQEMSVT
jgi:hypothetical protein